MLLHRPIGLDVQSLQDKLVRRPRGGHCYEHNLLFGALLERLGFRVRRLAGRVRMRPADRGESSGPGSDAPPPRSHAVLRVEAGGTSWLADVGFGGEGLLEPIHFVDGAASRQGGWTFRLDRSGGDWVLRSPHPEGWFDLYSVDLAVQHHGDFVVQQHFTATHPDSPFVSRVIVQRTGPLARHTLVGDELRTIRPDGSTDRRTVPAAELAEVFRTTFGIGLDPAELAHLIAGAR